ncbi:amidase [Aulographum hederae CBS 113979]|uniref:amidase n=1 Tax=Aulographum hederae CBS 113979 TaxID=1176131 RepID=A0A6G1GSA3_9PEZI|nr:amidase [Aulographum hederae CBS 113979]
MERKSSFGLKTTPQGQPTWQELAAAAQARRALSLNALFDDQPNPWNPYPFLSDLKKKATNALNVPRQVLHEKDFEITETLPEDLIPAMATGKLKALDVTLAFLRRAYVAQEMTNCLTELLVHDALTQARKLDAFYEEFNKPVGPLHGLPISVKESLGLSGHRLDGGYVAKVEDFAEVDAHVIHILKKAGAVIHARTTQPQSIMQLETESNIYGRTVNPYSKLHSPGGSSGGEGALIAMKGSCLGIGTDIGGSIRSPAANCGIWGFKPSAFRIASDGWVSNPAACDPIPTVVGPLSTSLEGIKMFMNAVLDAKAWISEPSLLPIPWEIPRWGTTSPLRIAVMTHDGVVLPHPPILRALREATEHLKRFKNVTVTEWAPQKLDEAWKVTRTLYYPDGGKGDRDIMAESGEPVLPLTEWILGDRHELSQAELMYWEERRESYRKMHARVWNDTRTKEDLDRQWQSEDDGIDAILCPVGPGCAPVHGTAKYWSYTSQWNLLDYPAIVFPFNKADKETDTWEKYTPEGYSGPMSETDKFNRDLYDPELSHGLPVGLQLVSRRLQDAEVVGILDFLVQSGICNSAVK